MKRLPTLALLAIVPVAVVACGGDDDAASVTTLAATSTITTGSAAGAFNQADVTFAQRMIPHHQQAVAMADIALDPTVQASPDVVALATQIKAAQDPEIEQMTGWLRAWGQPAPTAMGGATMGSIGDMELGDMEMGGMMSDDEMGALGAARGGDFDRLWMTSMIRHHQGAIEMATIEQRDGQAPEAVDLAGRIITAQQAEIDEMNELLAATG